MEKETTCRLPCETLEPPPLVSIVLSFVTSVEEKSQRGIVFLTI